MSVKNHHINILRLANYQKGGSVFVGAIEDLNVTAFDDTTITLDWTTPSADNPIDYYEVYLDGVFYENTTDATEGWVITGLTAFTSYDITLKTVDTLGNKSGFSNEVTQVTTGAFNFATNMMAYWKLAVNANDSSGRGNNGTATGITYSGGYAQFAVSRYIDVADTTDLSFTDGTNDLIAGLLIAFKQTDKTGTQYIINKRGNSDNREWQVLWFGGDLYIQFLSPTSSPNSFLSLVISGGLISTGVLNTIYFEYDGSKSHTGLKAYLNGNTSVGTSSVNGTYTGQVNGNSIVRMGAQSSIFSNYWTADGKEFAVWKGRTMTGAEIQELHDRVVAGTPLI